MSKKRSLPPVADWARMTIDNVQDNGTSLQRIRITIWPKHGRPIVRERDITTLEAAGADLFARRTIEPLV